MTIPGLNKGNPRDGKYVLAYLRFRNHPHLVACVAWNISGQWWTGLAGSYGKIGAGIHDDCEVAGWVDCVLGGVPKESV